jgi:hypothetical protein
MNVDINNCNIDNSVGKSINNNIFLVGCGKEDFSKIDKKELLRAIKSGFDSTINLTEIVHFNPKYPEFHNVYIPNIKDKYAMKFNGSQWELVTKSELIDSIYDDKKNYIEENLDKFIESLSRSQKRALDRWLETDDNDGKIKAIKDRLKLLLYNKRNIVQKNKQLCL